MTFSIPPAWQATRSKNTWIRCPQIVRADLTGADLSNLWFDDAEASGVVLRRANLDGFRARGGAFSQADFVAALFDDTRFFDLALRGSNFAAVFFKRSMMAACDAGEVNFEDADLTGSDLTETVFPKARMARANLTRVVAKSCSFEGADLTDADFSGATLKGARFRHAKLDNVVWTGADLTHAKFDPGFIPRT